MTPEQLDELEALAHRYRIAHDRWRDTSEGRNSYFAHYPEWRELQESELDFRAAARTAVPEIIAEVRRLQALELERSEALKAVQNLGQKFDLAAAGKCGAGHENCPGYTWVNGTKRYCSYEDYVDD